jgi:diguanylate cyclase (GGDEF)-like protein
MGNASLYIHILVFLVLIGILIFLFFRIQYFRRLSLTDEFTTFLNYKGACSRIQKNIRKNRIFTLALIDIDHFRKFNEIGYEFGDSVIKEFSSRLKILLPENTVIARFRIGDEFIIVFNDMNIIEVSECLKRIKSDCTLYHFNCLQPYPKLTFSFSEGVVEYGNPTDTIETLLSAAERLLKEKKHNL